MTTYELRCMVNLQIECLADLAYKVRDTDPARHDKLLKMCHCLYLAKVETLDTPTEE